HRTSPSSVRSRPALDMIPPVARVASPVLRRNMVMRTVWTFHGPGSLVFGRDAVHQLGDIAGHAGARRTLIITDPMPVKPGVVETVRQPLSSAGIAVEVFDGGEPEPSMRAAEACLAQARTVQPDFLIGLGGGSNMDLAKCTATLLMHGGHPHDYVGDS